MGVKRGATGDLLRLAVTPRWLGYLAAALLAAAICAGLGSWQLDRLSQVQTQNVLIGAHYRADPVDFSVAQQWLSQWDGSREWTPVSMRGRYLLEDQRIVRNRPRGGQPGYEALVPLRLSSGQTVVVDRGWLPIGNRQRGKPDAVPEPVAGEVTVVGRLRTAEPALERTAPDGQLASIDLGDYSRHVGYPLVKTVYIQMWQENPAASQNPAPFSEPAQDEGPHLSYALQWFAFGTLFFIAWGYVLVQEHRSPTAPASTQALAPVRVARRGRARGVDEQEEDALIDQQDAASARSGKSFLGSTDGR